MLFHFLVVSFFFSLEDHVVVGVVSLPIDSSIHVIIFTSCPFTLRLSWVAVRKNWFKTDECTYSYYALTENFLFYFISFHIVYTFSHSVGWFSFVSFPPRPG